ncbi:hypothetical protein C8Q75DRAFT_693463, partial [Abortiporus biennis]
IPQLPHVITYRLNGDKMAYVTTASNFVDAIKNAKIVFPEELSHIDNQRISFSLPVNMRGEKQHVVIGAMAWQPVVSGLRQYEVVDVTILPDEPPQYTQTNCSYVDEKEHIDMDMLTVPSPSQCRR